MADVKSKTILEAAANNDLEAMKYFVEEKHVKMTTCDAEERTAAHIAVETGNLPLLKYLVGKNPSIVTATNKTGRNIFILAVERGELDMVKFFLEEAEESVERAHNYFYGNTAVHIAALRGQMEILKYFLEDQKIDVDIRSEFGETPLFLAVEQADMPIVKYLIEKHKARISITDDNNDNILYISARKGDLNVPRYILDEQRRRINLNFRDYFGETILHRAVKFNHLPFVKYLVDEKQVEVNLPDDSGKTPLHHAATNNNFDIVKHLCDNGAYTDVRDDYNKTALESATEERVVAFLKDLTPTFVQTPLRHRRSMSESFIACFQNSPSYYATGKNIEFGSQDVLNSDYPPLAQFGFPYLESVLTLTWIFLKYSNVIAYIRTQPTSLTREDILLKKIDPVAVDVIEKLDFKN